VPPRHSYGNYNTDERQIIHQTNDSVKSSGKLLHLSMNLEYLGFLSKAYQSGKMASLVQPIPCPEPGSPY